MQNMFNADKKNTRMNSHLNTVTPWYARTRVCIRWLQYLNERYSGVFIVNFEDISQFFLVFLLLNL